MKFNFLILLLFLSFVNPLAMAQTPSSSAAPAATPSTPAATPSTPAVPKISPPPPVPQPQVEKKAHKKVLPKVTLSRPTGDGKTTYDKDSAQEIKTEVFTVDDKAKQKRRIRNMYAVFEVEYTLGRSKKRKQFKFKLYHNYVPETVNNFVELVEGNKEFKDPETEKMVKKPFYNGLVFHRIAKNFVMQTGELKGSNIGNIPLELNDTLVHDRFGVVSMARMGNESHGSQFFITFAPAPHLDNFNTVFGQVVDKNSVLVLQEIEKVKADRTDKPKYPVTIISAKIEKFY
ncbi:MAG: peptidylprolyl isomerase [Bdellovibrionaceae bacterium]|nr:peptidylprolyl isomerase [Pseudobdellovibrionaceae bacterium]